MWPKNQEEKKGKKKTQLPSPLFFPGQLGPPWGLGWHPLTMQLYSSSSISFTFRQYDWGTRRTISVAVIPGCYPDVSPKGPS